MSSGARRVGRRGRVGGCQALGEQVVKALGQVAVDGRGDERQQLLQARVGLAHDLGALVRQHARLLLEQLGHLRVR